MTYTRNASRIERVMLLSLVCVASPSVLTAQSPWGFASRAQRTTDAVIARDLAWFDSLSTASAGSRAQVYVLLARESYERNDEGTLTAALLASDRAPESSVTTHRPDLWSVLHDARRAGLPESDALEVALLRARHPLLGAPSCAQWERDAERLAAAVGMTLADRSAAERARAPGAGGTPRAAGAVSAAPRAEPTAVAPVTLPTAIPDRVHFALDRAELSDRSRAVLDVVVDSLARVRDVRIILEGHTDVRASDAYNAALSSRRALAVRDYLLSRGVVASYIQMEPRGRARPEMRGRSPVDHARNRRVIMRFTTRDGVTLITLEQREDLQPERP